MVFIDSFFLELQRFDTKNYEYNSAQSFWSQTNWRGKRFTCKTVSLPSSRSQRYSGKG